MKDILYPPVEKYMDKLLPKRDARRVGPPSAEAIRSPNKRSTRRTG